MDDRERADGPDEAGRDDEFDRESVTAYIVDEVARAFAAHDRAARGTVQRTLPLGEMLALFNLADQFGLIDRVRAELDGRRGGDAYLAFSEAMKAALLDRGQAGGGGGGGRPPERGRDSRQGRPDHRPPRGGGRPPGRPDRRP